MRAQCAGCGEALDIVIEQKAMDELWIDCTVCHRLTVVQSLVCLICGGPLPEHRDICPMARDQRLWGV